MASWVVLVQEKVVHIVGSLDSLNATLMPIHGDYFNQPLAEAGKIAIIG
jgi:hypothetical protein